MTQCPPVQGYVVYAQSVTCGTARTNVKKLLALPFTRVRVTIRTVPNYLCVATYGKKTRKQRAGSCLKTGSVATGFGWTRNGAVVPLPPGVDAGTAGGTATGGGAAGGSGGGGYDP